MHYLKANKECYNRTVAVSPLFKTFKVLRVRSVTMRECSDWILFFLKESFEYNTITTTQSLQTMLLIPYVSFEDTVFKEIFKVTCDAAVTKALRYYYLGHMSENVKFCWFFCHWYSEPLSYSYVCLTPCFWHCDIYGYIALRNLPQHCK